MHPRRPGMKNPYYSPATRVRQFVFAPTTLNVVFAATGVAFGRRNFAGFSNFRTNSEFPVSVEDLIFAFGGFAAGSGLCQIFRMARRFAIKRLLAYQAWLTDSVSNPSKKTKIWAVLLKIFIGPGPHRLFEFEDLLPDLPLPSLEDTCQKFLENVKPLQNDEEYLQTNVAVEEFLNNEGPRLQHYLLKRSKTHRNWLAQWWLEECYLKNRQPIAVNVNFFMTSCLQPEISKDDLERAAGCALHVTRYYELIKNGNLLPDMIQDVVPVSMDNLKYMLASCRVPRVAMDELFVAKESEHIVVVCNGEYYKLQMYKRKSKNKKEIMTIEEIKKQLKFIRSLSKTTDTSKINKVASLTSTDRDLWTKNRQLLIQNNKNAATIKEIESAIFLLVLGSDPPASLNELVHLAMVGDGTTRWFDKGLTVEVFKDSSFGVGNMEHSAADATHFNVMWEHCLQHETVQLEQQRNVIKNDINVELDPPVKLEWEFSNEIHQAIEDAYNHFVNMANDFVQMTYHTKYGKRWMKSKNISPDGFLQMAVQLTYYKIHKEFTKTYEPASHRLFTQGRTENINPVSDASVDFVLSYFRSDCADADKVEKLRRSVREQNSRRLQATAGFGVDRHLLGLKRAAEDLGVPTPGLFKTKAYNLEMKLSTSQVPTNVAQLFSHLVPQYNMGGFGPACLDGYGLMYVNMGDDMFNFNITGWKSSGVSDVKTFVHELDVTLAELKDLLGRN